MKVAFLSDTYWPRVNGVTVSTDIFMKELRSMGHDVRLWAPEYPPTSPGAVQPHEAPWISRFRSIGVFFSQEDRLPDPFQRREFYRQLDEFGPELIHVQTEVSSLYVRAYARRRGVPVVQTCHTYFEQYIAFYFPAFPADACRAFARWLTRRLVKTADALISPTEAMKTVIQAYGIKTPVTVVPTGIAEDDFAGVDKALEQSSSTWFDRFPVLKNRKLLLYVGRVAQEKNVDFLLDVVDRVRKDQPQALLLVAGNGPYLEGFQAKASQRGLSDSVLCLGYVNHGELKHLYTLAQVFVFASVTETQGLVTIEAMMCGTPAVAIGKMGTKEVMAGDNGGFMVDENVEAFSAAVVGLLADHTLYAAKSAEAKLYAKNWSAERMAKRIEALYVQVLEQHRARGPQ